MNKAPPAPNNPRGRAPPPPPPPKTKKGPIKPPIDPQQQNSKIQQTNNATQLSFQKTTQNNDSNNNTNNLINNNNDNDNNDNDSNKLPKIQKQQKQTNITLDKNNNNKDISNDNNNINIGQAQVKQQQSNINRNTQNIGEQSINQPLNTNINQQQSQQISLSTIPRKVPPPPITARKVVPKAGFPQIKKPLQAPKPPPVQIRPTQTPQTPQQPPSIVNVNNVNEQQSTNEVFPQNKQIQNPLFNQAPQTPTELYRQSQEGYQTPSRPHQVQIPDTPHKQKFIEQTSRLATNQQVEEKQQGKTLQYKQQLLGNKKPTIVATKKLNKTLPPPVISKGKVVNAPVRPNKLPQRFQTQQDIQLTQQNDKQQQKNNVKVNPTKPTQFQQDKILANKNKQQENAVPVVNKKLIQHKNTAPQFLSSLTPKYAKLKSKLTDFSRKRDTLLQSSESDSQIQSQTHSQMDKSKNFKDTPHLALSVKHNKKKQDSIIQNMSFTPFKQNIKFQEVSPVKEEIKQIQIVPEQQQIQNNNNSFGLAPTLKNQLQKQQLPLKSIQIKEQPTNMMQTKQNQQENIQTKISKKQQVEVNIKNNQQVIQNRSIQNLNRKSLGLDKINTKQPIHEVQEEHGQNSPNKLTEKRQKQQKVHTQAPPIKNNVPHRNVLQTKISQQLRHIRQKTQKYGEKVDLNEMNRLLQDFANRKQSYLKNAQQLSAMCCQNRQQESKKIEIINTLLMKLQQQNIKLKSVLLNY